MVDRLTREVRMMNPSPVATGPAGGWPLAAGCGDGEPTGTTCPGRVTFAGQPVVSGRIYFAPDPARGNDGPQGYAAIEDGRYDTAKGGEPAASAGRSSSASTATARRRPDYPHGKPLFIEYKVTRRAAPRGGRPTTSTCRPRRR